MPQYRRSLAAVGLAFGLLAAPLAQADEVTDALNDAIAAYEEGDLAYAKEMLDYASQLVAQQKAGTLTDLLPEPLDGWTAKEAESQNVGAAMFGGGTTAAREYSSEGKSLRIQYMADSPMLAQMGAMFANPALIGASGGKMTRIGRQTAMIEKNGNVQFMVDNRILVQIEGSASEDDKLAYAKAIDIKKLKDY